MFGREDISRALVTGRFLGVGAGSLLEDVEERLGAHVRQLHGSKHRYLRLDFGLVEVTFGDEPDWACHWLAVHPHRLVEVPGLAEECEKGFALEFSGIITWEQLSLEVRENAVLVDTSASGVQFRIPTVKATVHLSKNVDDSELGRVIEKIVIGV